MASQREWNMKYVADQGLEDKLSEAISAAMDARAEDACRFIADYLGGRDRKQFHVRKPLPPFLCVLDNKGGHVGKPRLGVVHNGCFEVVDAGDASVLAVNDLESLSLIRAEEALYVAVSL